MRPKKPFYKKFLSTKVPRRIKKKLTKFTYSSKEDFNNMSDLEIILYFLNNDSFLMFFMHYFRGKTYKESKEYIYKSLYYINHKEFAQRIRLYSSAYMKDKKYSESFFKNIIFDLEESISDLKFNTYHTLDNYLEESFIQKFFPAPFTMPVSSEKYSFSRDFFFQEPKTKTLRDNYSLDYKSYKKYLFEIYKEGITPQSLN